MNEASAVDREELRAYAVGLVREQVREVETVAVGSGAGESRPSSFNPVAMGIPVFLVGSLLVFLFPPVGILLFVVAGVLVIWGILATLFSGRSARRG